MDANRPPPQTVGAASPMPLLVVGASARAAAFSARRAGYSPLAVDMFADVDLIACCAVRQWNYASKRLLRIVKRLPACPWLYTGALENRPQLVERLAAQRPLYGNRRAALVAVRDPWRLAAVLQQHGFRAAPLLDDSRCRRSTVSGPWLQKPLRGSGGRGILRMGDKESAVGGTKGTYLQQYIPGPSFGAVYVAAAQHTQLLGITRQLIGAGWTGASGFQYAGSLGPVWLPDGQREQFERLGSTVAAAFGLRGLFGIDAVVNDEGVWPLEVNPRYTASVEILERAYDVRAIAHHVAACSGQPPALERLAGSDDSRQYGKAILFARRSVKVSQEFSTMAARRHAGQAWPDVADIPAGGSIIRAGRAVTTVFAEGASAPDVQLALQQRVAEIQQLLGC